MRRRMFRQRQRIRWRKIGLLRFADVWLLKGVGARWSFERPARGVSSAWI
jgi:hypothetical protein